MYDRVTIHNSDQKSERIGIYIRNNYYYTILRSMIHYKRYKRNINTVDDLLNVAYTNKLFDKILKKEKTPILVGGTGLYIKSHFRERRIHLR